MDKHPSTPDRQHFVVRQRPLATVGPVTTGRTSHCPCRRAHPGQARGGQALRHADEVGIAKARAAVDRAKVALGERGPVWWHDGAPDLNRRMVAGTPYAGWLEQQSDPE